MYDKPNSFSNGSGATSLSAGPYNALGYPTLSKYVSGSTNSIGLIAAAGGTTINSFDCSGMDDGFTFFVHNDSNTDPLIFPHLAANNVNPFKNPNGGSVQIPPNGAARCTFKLGYLRWA